MEQLREDLQSIKRTITYVEGPQGQRVVIVPQQRESTEEEVNECMYGCCLAITLIVAFVLLLMGIIYGSIMLSLYDPETSWDNDFFWSMVTAAFWLLGIGGGCLLTSLCICKCQSTDKSKRRRRYMYASGPDTQLLVEDVNDGAFGMQGISQDRSPLSSRAAPFAQQFNFQPSQYTGSRQPSPSAYMGPTQPYSSDYMGPGQPSLSTFMGQRQPSPSEYMGQRQPSPSEYMGLRQPSPSHYMGPRQPSQSDYMGHRHPSPTLTQSQFTYERNNPPNQFSEQRSPSRSGYPSQYPMPGRTYPGMSAEMANHSQLESPGDRSFSPDSDTTYLSYRS